MKVVNILTRNHLFNVKLICGKVMEYVDKIIVLDTGSTDGTVEWIRDYASKRGVGYLEPPDIKGANRFKNIELFQCEWNNDFEGAINYLTSLNNEGDWVLFLEDDEIPSRTLLENLDLIIERCEKENIVVVQLPGIKIQDGIPERPFRYLPMDKGFVIKEHLSGPPLKWYTRYWLWKKCPELFWQCTGPHCGLSGVDKHLWAPYPVFVMKTLQSLWESAMWVLYLTALERPECCGIDPEDAKELVEITKRDGIVDSQQIVSRMKGGSISAEFKSWIIKNKDKRTWIPSTDNIERPTDIYRAFYELYFKFYHPEEESEISKIC